MTSPVVTTPSPIVRNATDTGSFFAAQQENPTGNPLVVQQVDTTAPQIKGLARIANPIQPAQNAQNYVKNFDPNLYDLRDSSHLMRLIRGLCGASGVGGLRKQNLSARIASLLTQGSFLDLDGFYGEIFGLQRREIESFPTNLDGSTVNPYTDLAHSDVWDELISKDARYRSRLFQLARAVNMGATYPGLKAAAEAVVNCDVDIVESWVITDFANNQSGLQPIVSQSYFTIENQYVTYGNIKQSYGALAGSQFGGSQLPVGNRGELIFTPKRLLTNEEQYQLVNVLNVLKPSHCQITIAVPLVQTSSTITPRGFSSDSENWQIQSRVTPALNLINPTTPIYQNTGPYSQARPVYSEYTGENWTYVPNTVKISSYQQNTITPALINDDQNITYSDGTSHNYVASDGVRDARQAVSYRLSGEGVVTNFPFNGNRVNYATGGK